MKQIILRRDYLQLSYSIFTTMNAINDHHYDHKIFPQTMIKVDILTVHNLVIFFH